VDGVDAASAEAEISRRCAEIFAEIFAEMRAVLRRPRLGIEGDATYKLETGELCLAKRAY
jgi:hypothetical protein